MTSILSWPQCANYNNDYMSFQSREWCTRFLRHAYFNPLSLLDKMVAIFEDDIFKRIFLNEYARISIQISLKFVPNGRIDNTSALAQVKAISWSNDAPVYRCMYAALGWVKLVSIEIVFLSLYLILLHVSLNYQSQWKTEIHEY